MKSLVVTPVIIEAALSGYAAAAANPRNPVSPQHIASDALDCIRAGASIIHNHIENTALTGTRAADRYAEGWAPVLNEYPDAILYSTTTSARTIAEKIAHYAPLAAAGMRMGVLDPGTTNLGCN